MGHFGRLEVGWESGVLEHKSGNIGISETRKDKRKVTMEGLYEVTNALSNGTIPDPLRPSFSCTEGLQPPPRTPIAIISRTGKATKFQFCTHVYRLNRNKSPLKISGK